MSVIKPIDKPSIHQITSGQVVIDLQTAVKELVENSLDAGATNIEVRFKDNGVKSVEIIDNGTGIDPDDYESVGLKHHTSKLATFLDLTTVLTFGFRGEAISSLCALSESVTVVTSTAPQNGLGAKLGFDSAGRLKGKPGKVARQRGTTVTVNSLFKPLPVRRKELERNAKREFGKALGLLYAYALVPCSGGSASDASGKGVRMTVTNQLDNGRKTTHITTSPSSSRSLHSTVSSLWGPKALEHLVDLDITFTFSLFPGNGKGKAKQPRTDEQEIQVRVCGLISKFVGGSGRTSTDRQFFYVNGRPWSGGKVQKAVNEVYRSFNAPSTSMTSSSSSAQFPFVVADFIIPTNACDINVSPDKRTIFLSGEAEFVAAFKASLEESFTPSMSTYTVSQAKATREEETSPQQTRKESARNKGDISGPSLKTALKESSQDIADKTPLIEENDEDDTQTLIESVIPPALSPSGTAVASSSPLFLPDPDSESEEQGAVSPVKSHATSEPTSDLTTHGEEDQPVEQDTPELEEDHPKLAKRYIQTVLDTSGAIWNQKKSNSGSEADPSRKGEASSSNAPTIKQRDISSFVSASVSEASSEPGPSRKGSRLDASSSNAPTIKQRDITSFVNAKEERKSSTTLQEMRVRLSGFANPGAVPKAVRGVLEEDEEMEVDELMSSPARGHVSRRGVSPQLGNEGDEVQSARKEGGISARLSGLSRQDAITITGSAEMEDDELEPHPPNDTPQGPKPEIIRSESSSDEISIRFDLDKVSKAWHSLSSEKGGLSNTSKPVQGGQVLADASFANAEYETKATEALSRVIEKADFLEMEIVGQFNLGFIITRRRKLLDGMDDLFIVDQHAADEKYNFETLQLTTVIESQKLLRPRELELTASDELVAIDNIEALKRNGFELDLNLDEDDASGRQRRSRLRLLAQPVSKNTTFDMKDLEELIHLMRDAPTAQNHRCTKARAMFAMRACRKSVMVGMPLTKTQMTSVVRHMANMDQPWNCPHGRPTMRHLTDISDARHRRASAKEVNWAGLSQ